MTETQLAVMKRLVNDFTFFAPNALRLRDKQTSALVPFVLNEAQRIIHARLESQKARTGFVRAVIVKGRQQGCSSYTAGRFFHQAMFEPHKDIFICAHRADSTAHLYSMAREYYRNLPKEIQPKLLRDNATELTLENGTSYSAGTAGSGDVGRGRTIQNLHGSEIAYWDRGSEIAMGLLQAIPLAAGTEIILESTAKGPGDFFAAQAFRAAGNMNEDGTMKDWKDFQLVFISWLLQTEYTSVPFEGEEVVLTDEEKDIQRLYGASIPHILWRRRKIQDFTCGNDIASAELRFQREYPFSVEDAFRANDLSFFDPLLIAEAVRRKKDFDMAQQVPTGAVVIGVDPAGDSGRDKTVIVIRVGKYVKDVISYDRMNAMQLAGILARLIEKEQADAVFVDAGGGEGTVERLGELGFRKGVVSVAFGASADNKKAYRNKRIEMHAELREWLAEGGMLPNHPTLLSDMHNLPMEKESSSGGKYLVSKDDIRELTGRSPDFLDALALTFAYPVRSRTEKAEVTARRERVGKSKAKPDPFESIVKRRAR